MTQAVAPYEVEKSRAYDFLLTVGSPGIILKSKSKKQKAVLLVLDVHLSEWLQSMRSRSVVRRCYNMRR